MGMLLHRRGVTATKKATKAENVTPVDEKKEAKTKDTKRSEK